MPLSSPTPGYSRPSNSFSNPVSGNLLDPAAAIATWADYDTAIDTLAKKAARGDIAQTLSNAEKAQALANIGGVGLAVGAITSVASAATVDLGAQPTFRVLITGATPITSFGTVADQYRQIRFAGALTLTHNATTLILPGAANITTAAGDTAYVVSDGSGNWRVVAYQRADGTALDGVRVNVAQSLTGAQALQARANIGANNSLARTVTSASSAGDRTLTAADCGRLIILSGTTDFTLTIDPAANLGNGWSVNVKVAGRCLVTVDPNASEQIDGATTIPLAFRQQCTIVCTGSAFETFGLSKRVLLESQDVANVAQVDFLLPPGYENYRVSIACNVLTSAQNIQARLSTDNGATFVNAAGAYLGGFIVPNGTSTIVTAFSNSISAIDLWAGSPTSDRLTALTVDIFSARNASARTLMTCLGAGDRATFARGPQILTGERAALEVNNAVRFFPAANNFTGRFMLTGEQL